MLVFSTRYVSFRILMEQGKYAEVQGTGSGYQRNVVVAGRSTDSPIFAHLSQEDSRPRSVLALDLQMRRERDGGQTTVVEA
jgi:hypothetical protein